MTNEIENDAPEGEPSVSTEAIDEHTYAENLGQFMIGAGAHFVESNDGASI